MEPQINADSRRSSADEDVNHDAPAHDLSAADDEDGETTCAGLDDPLSRLAGAVRDQPVHDLAARLSSGNDDAIPPRGGWGWVAYPVALLGAVFVWGSVAAFESLIALAVLKPLYEQFGAGSAALYIVGGVLVFVLSILPSIAATLSFRGTLRLYMPERYLALKRRREREKSRRHGRLIVLNRM